MIRVSVISAPDPGCGPLERLRRYASIPDGSHDVLLSGLLKRAALTVQEYADASVIPCIFRLTVDGYNGNPVRLYQSSPEVISVTDSEHNPVDWRLSGNLLTTSGNVRHLDIVYRTTPDEGEVDRLMPVVLRYATALYDGLDGEELSAILAEVC